MCVCVVGCVCVLGWCGGPMCVCACRCVCVLCACVLQCDGGPCVCVCVCVCAHAEAHSVGPDHKEFSPSIKMHPRRWREGWPMCALLLENEMLGAATGTLVEDTARSLGDPRARHVAVTGGPRGPREAGFTASLEQTQAAPTLTRTQGQKEAGGWRGGARRRPVALWAGRGRGGCPGRMPGEGPGLTEHLSLARAGNLGP